MDLTDAYENGKYIPGAASYPPKWEAAAAAFRERLGRRAQIGLGYGGIPWAVRLRSPQAIFPSRLSM